MKEKERDNGAAVVVLLFFTVIITVLAIPLVAYVISGAAGIDIGNLASVFFRYWVTLFSLFLLIFQVDRFKKLSLEDKAGLTCITPQRKAVCFVALSIVMLLTASKVYDRVLSYDAEYLNPLVTESASTLLDVSEDGTEILQLAMYGTSNASKAMMLQSSLLITYAADMSKIFVGYPIEPYMLPKYTGSDKLINHVVQSNRDFYDALIAFEEVYLNYANVPEEAWTDDMKAEVIEVQDAIALQFESLTEELNTYATYSYGSVIVSFCNAICIVIIGWTVIRAGMYKHYVRKMQKQGII